MFFVGDKPAIEILQQCLAAVQLQIGDWIGLKRDLDRGFFQNLTRQTSTTQKLLMLTPHHSKWGTCIIQMWASGFNANYLSQLKVHTWVILGESLVRFSRLQRRLQVTLVTYSEVTRGTLLPRSSIFVLLSKLTSVKKPNSWLLIQAPKKGY
jgi:hypothetical protein